MQRPRSKTVTLADILITEELSRRSPRPPNWQAEAQAMQSLARQMARDLDLMQTLVETALELCQAGTAGVSLLETAPDGEEILRWNVLAGALAQYVGGSAPRNFSVCGVCLDRGTPQLFSHPERYFTYFQAANTPIVEALVLPLITDNHALGSLWIMSHDLSRHFDLEDVRVMTSLADFTAAALLLKQQQTQELLAANVRLEAEIAERKRTEETAREAEAYFRAIANLVPDMLWRNNSTGDTSWYNDRWLDYTGQTLLEAQGYGWLEVIHPSDRAQSLTNFQNAVDQRRPLRQEQRIRGRDGSYRWFQVQVEPVFDADGRIVQWFGAAIDIHEQRMALEALRESEERLRAMIENLPGGAAFVVDRDLHYLLAEGEALSQAGFTSEDFVGQTIFQVIPPELLPSYEALYRQGLAGETFELEHNISDRTYVSRGTPLRSPNGEVYAVLAVSYDISDRQQAETALRESEERFRLFVTASSDIIYRMSADWREMRRLEGNNFIANTDNASQTWIETYIPLEEQSRVWAAIQSAIDTKSMFELEHQVIQQDSAIGWTFSRAIPMLNEQGDIVEWFGTASDVTQRKRSEEALRESEERFRTLANTAPALIWYNDAQGNNLYLNQYFLDFTGKSAEQIRGEDWHTLIHPDDAEAYIADYLAAVREQRSWYNRNRIRRYDGVWRWHDNYAQPLFSADGVYLGHVGVTIDNTNAIEAEIALRESEAKYRALFNAMDEGYMLSEVIFDENDKPIDILYLEANPAAIRLAGRDFSGQRMREIDPNYEEYWYEIYGRIALTGEAVRAERYAETHGRWFDFYAFKVGEWESRRVATVFQDISDRKRTEVALRESEERLRDVLNSMTEGFALLGGDFTILDVNEETLRLDGRSRDQLIGRSHWDAFPGTEDSPVGEIFRRVARERIPASLEHMYRWPDERSLWIDMRAYPTRNDGVAIFWRDVTDRKQAEAALRESEAKYRSLFNSMDEAYAVVEVMTGENGEWNDFLFLEVNPAFVKQTGMEYPVGRKATELLGTPNPQWAKIYGRVAETGEPIRLEEGEATLGRVFDLYVFRLGGEGSRRVAVLFTDITDRKRAEAQLRRAAEIDAFRVKLADALRSLTDPVQIQAEACRLLGEQLGVDRAYYVEVHEAEGYARVNQHYSRGDSPSIVGNYRLSEYGWSLPIMRRGETIVITDTQSTTIIPDAERAAMAMINMVGFVAISLIKGEVLVGSLAVNEPTPREWTETEVELVRETAERIWADIQRAHAETALRQSEEKFRTLFDSIDEGLAFQEMIYDDQGEICDIIFRQVNRAYERHGHVYDVVGRSIFDVSSGVEDYWLDLYKRVAKNGESVREENYQQDVDRWFDVYFTRVDDNGRFVAIVFADITDRKHAEAQLRRVAEIDAFRVKLSDALRSLSDPLEIQSVAMRVLGEHLQVDRVMYSEIDEAETTHIISDNYVRKGYPKLIGRFPTKDFAELTDRARLAPFAVEDMTADDRLSEATRAAFVALDVYSVISVSLAKGDRWVANFGIHHSKPRQWRDEEIDLVQETADRTWAAVERAQVGEDLRKSEEKYRKIFENIDQGFSIHELIIDESDHVTDVILQEVNEAFEQHTGIKNAQGKKASEFVLKLEPVWLDAMTRAYKWGETQHFEAYNSDTNRWITSQYSRLGGAGSRLLSTVFTDITERKQRELNTALLDEIGKDLSRLSAPDEIMQTVSKRLCEFLELSGCYFVDVDEAKNEVAVHHGWASEELPSLMQTFNLEDYLSEDFLRTMRAGAVFVMRDTAQDERAEAQSYARLKVGSFVTVPFFRNGRYTGHIAVTTEQPHDWQPHEIQLLQEISSRVFPRIERARAEEALRESEAKYRSLFESINDAFALLEVLYDDDNQPVDCRLLEVSPSFEVETGLPQAQGKTLKELIPSIEPDWFEHYHQALVTNDLVHFEMWEDYLKTWLEVDAFPYGNPQDRQVIIVFRNINERKQAQANQIQLIREQSAREQERQRAETLVELDRAKTLFFSNISHEFRTPLTLSLAPLQDALSDRTLPSAHRERLELAHRNSLRLLKLVNMLLDFSRIEAGRMEAVYEPTDLAQFTAELASVFRSAIEQAGLRLIVNCLPLPEAVYVDREMWEKIVLNLISNAFKFTLEGEIIVKLQPVDHHVILEVEDTGTGIAPEELPHLFERFYQVRGIQARLGKAHASRSHEGSGIGLALVHELVQLQGGTINVSSMPGQGSCFTIALPFGSEHLPQEQIKASHTLTSTAIGAAPYVQEAELWLPQESAELEENSLTQNSKFFTRNSQTARILIVDDNADMRDYLTRILSDRFQVEAVADGAAALLAAQAQVPDLILSDVMMPGLDGFQLLQALRADPRTREVPIILLSARAGEEAIIEGLEAGADDYLIKPFSASELVSRVNAHLQSAQLHSEALAQERTLNRRKDELLSIVSHELNTPLVAILGWTRLLRATPPSQSILSKSLDTIERNAMLQAKLIQDLLDISRIEAGKLRLRLEPVQLKSVIESAIAAVLTAAIAKDIHLEWQHSSVAEASEITIMGDHDRLQQIVCNLLTNGIKFTPNSGSVTVKLSIIKGEKPEASYAQIQVTDTGIGISEEFLPYVFEQFRQAEGVDSAKGLGLGLAIARHLVQLHNGTIHAQSLGAGQGATFIVKLPILQEL